LHDSQGVDRGQGLLSALLCHWIWQLERDATGFEIFFAKPAQSLRGSFDLFNCSSNATAFHSIPSML
jgi:hypothetical protein